MAESSVTKKLGIRPGQKLLILNAPDGYLKTLEPLPQGAEIKTHAGGTFDFVQVFVSSKADVDKQAAGAIKAVKPAGNLWFAYPKKTSKIKSDISRDVGWESVHKAGWEGVFLISIDDTWSSMRYRPHSEIKSRQAKQEKQKD